MNKFSNNNRIEKHVEPKGSNSPFITVKGSNGYVRKANPAYIKNLCTKCGKVKGLFHGLVCS
jgi:hypothetical protein